MAGAMGVVPARGALLKGTIDGRSCWTFQLDCGLIERLVGIINVYYIFNYGQIGNVGTSTHATAVTCYLPPAACHTPCHEIDDTRWQAVKLPRNTF